MTDFNEYFDGLMEKLGISHVKGSWEDEWIESEGIKLYAPVFTAGEGKPTVVYIPGTSVYALCYVEIMYGLQQEGFNVVGFDPKGQGRSGGGRGDYTIMEHVGNARSACAYARERFKGPVVVMGSSQGGIEAFYLAATDEPVAGCVCHNIADLTDPESVRLTRFGPGKKKGAQAPSTGKTDKKPVPRAAVIAARGAVNMLQAAARITPGAKVPIASYLDLKSEPMRAFGNAWEFLLQDPMALKAITLRAAASLAGTEIPRPIEEIKTPILVLHSSLDHIFPEDYIMTLYNRLTCEKEIKIYPELPHLITIEHVPEILPDVVRWINERVEAIS
jgi:alpha-beta hydrolase superfamily lysophospholipase